VVQDFTAGTQSSALFCTSSGTVYEERVYQIPEGSPADVGLSIHNLLRLPEDVRAIAVMPVPTQTEGTYLTMFTVQGKVKRTPFSELTDVHAGGTSAIHLDPEDELVWALPTDGQRELLVTTARGQTLRFAESEVLPKGAAAGGILGIRLIEGDRVVSVCAVEEDAEVLIATANGIAKRTAIAEYPSQGRNTQGVIALHAKYLASTGPVVAGLVVCSQDRITFLTANGMALHTDAAAIPQSGRTTRGQFVISLDADDRVVNVVRHQDAGIEQASA
jgi:DNA gyrase subunit A